MAGRVGSDVAKLRRDDENKAQPGEDGSNLQEDTAVPVFSNATPQRLVGVENGRNQLLKMRSNEKDTKTWWISG